MLDDFTQASRRGSSVMFSVRCTKCGRKYQTYWKSGQFIHCGCEAYLKALDTCKEFGVIPLFTREDWKGGSDKNRYLVRCCKCNSTFYTGFHGDRMILCQCSHSNSVNDRSFRDVMLLCEDNGVEPMFTRSEWHGYRPVSADTYLRYKVRCKSCGTVFEITFNRDFMVKCSCKKVWQWRSRREERVASMLESLGFNVIRNCRTLIKAITGQSMELDLYLPDLGVAFEFNGYQFHCSSLSEYSKPKTYHQRKTDECLGKGVRLYHIWEDTPDYLCDSLILSKLGLCERVYARECSIVKLPNGWFSNRHVDGDCVSQLRFGLAQDDKVVCGISFRFNNGYAEIARFSNEIGVTVVGGYSKLLKHSIPLIVERGFRQLVSFCNRDLSPDASNTVYAKMGFRLVGQHLSYKYYNQKTGREVVSRQLMTKAILSNRLEQMGISHTEMTEEDMAKLLGYSRVYNSGTFKFVMDI